MRRVGVRAAVGARLAESRGEHPVELIADEDPVAHQVPALRGHALVVVTDAGQAEFDGAVGGHVHHRRAVAHGAELVGGGERRSGVGGLVADRAVVFGCVTDGFVNGQPQVRRVDHQILAPGITLGALTFSASSDGSCASSSVQFHTSSPASASQPRPIGGASVRIESNLPAAASTVTASSDGSTRTRCWVIDDPKVSA